MRRRTRSLLNREAAVQSAWRDASFRPVEIFDQYRSRTIVLIARPGREEGHAHRKWRVCLGVCHPRDELKRKFASQLIAIERAEGELVREGSGGLANECSLARTGRALDPDDLRNSRMAAAASRSIAANSTSRPTKACLSPDGEPTSPTSSTVAPRRWELKNHWSEVNYEKFCLSATASRSVYRYARNKAPKGTTQSQDEGENIYRAGDDQRRRADQERHTPCHGDPSIERCGTEHYARSTRVPRRGHRPR